MTKTDITRAIERACGSVMVTKSQFAKQVLGLKNYRQAEVYFKGLQAINGRYYLASEIAGNMMRELH